jgi:pimeloyl-ACP methyl ester carboxylesterase
MFKRTAFWVASAFAIFAAVSLAEAQGVSGPKSTAPAFHVTVTGHGQPMILIPGLSSGGEVWDSSVVHYKDRYECHVLTLAGFAGQPPIEGPLLVTAREELAAYIRDKHLERPVIAGHSLGGFVALWLAAQHPELVGKIVIVDSLPALGAVMNPVISQQDLEINATRMRDGLLKATDAERLESQKTSIATMATAQADIDRIYGWAVASDGKTVANAMYELMSTDLRAQLAQIKAPTLVLGTWIAYEKYATEDQIRRNFELQYKSLANAQIKLAPKARHFIMYDQPDWMFAQIDGFLGAPATR